MNSIAFQGTWTALVTPFTAGGKAVDFPALEKLVEAQILGGVSGLVPVGTTGESPTLSEEEAFEVTRCVVQKAAGRVPVMTGTGSNSTKKTIESSMRALEAGAQAVMVVMPYYNKPSQAGLKAHVLEVAHNVQCPIILYNIPGRSIVDLAADTTEAICAAAPNVVGIKDATGNVLRCQWLKARLGDRLTVMCGDDGLTVAMMAVGASGVISVSSNVLPGSVSKVTTAMLKGDLVGARKTHNALLEMHEAMFLEPNPAPAKAVLAHRGLMLADVRLPLVPASEAVRGKVVDLVAAAERATA